MPFKEQIFIQTVIQQDILIVGQKEKDNLICSLPYLNPL